MSGLSFLIDGESATSSPRSTFRASLPGLTVQIIPSMLAFNVLDVSAGGLSFNAKVTYFKKGDNIKIRLIITGKILIEEIEAKVVRSIPNGMTALSFISISRKNENKLDKLILEIQKRHIELQKKKNEKTINKLF